MASESAPTDGDLQSADSDLQATQVVVEPPNATGHTDPTDQPDREQPVLEDVNGAVPVIAEDTLQPAGYTSNEAGSLGNCSEPAEEGQNPQQLTLVTPSCECRELPEGPQAGTDSAEQAVPTTKTAGDSSEPGKLLASPCVNQVSAALAGGLAASTWSPSLPPPGANVTAMPSGSGCASPSEAPEQPHLPSQQDMSVLEESFHRAKPTEDPSGEVRVPEQTCQHSLPAAPVHIASPELADDSSRLQPDQAAADLTAADTDGLPLPGPLEPCEESRGTEAEGRDGADAPPLPEPEVADLLRLRSSGPVPLPCTEHPELSSRPKRRPGGMALQNERFQEFLEKLRNSCTSIGQADGRVLRLKQYIGADARTNVIDAVLEALAENTTVEALYIQNFERGMHDEQLDRLVEVLTRKRIWALNVGENFEISLDAWSKFTKRLSDTAVSYLYVSEHHLMRTNLKVQMRDAIRVNRRALGPVDPAVSSLIGNMWYNPKVAPGYSARAVARQKAGLERHGHLLRQRQPGGTVRKAAGTELSARKVRERPKKRSRQKQTPRQPRAAAPAASSGPAPAADSRPVRQQPGAARGAQSTLQAAEAPQATARALARGAAASSSLPPARKRGRSAGVGARVRDGGPGAEAGGHHVQTAVAGTELLKQIKDRPQKNPEEHTLEALPVPAEVGAPVDAECPPRADQVTEPLRTLEGVVMLRQAPADPNKRQRKPTLRVQEALEAEPLFLQHKKTEAARKRSRGPPKELPRPQPQPQTRPLRHTEAAAGPAPACSQPPPSPAEAFPLWGPAKGRRSIMSRRPAARLLRSRQAALPAISAAGQGMSLGAGMGMTLPMISETEQTATALRHSPAFFSQLGAESAAGMSGLATLLRTNQYIMQLSQRQGCLPTTEPTGTRPLQEVDAFLGRDLPPSWAADIPDLELPDIRGAPVVNTAPLQQGAFYPQGGGLCLTQRAAPLMPAGPGQASPSLDCPTQFNWPYSPFR